MGQSQKIGQSLISILILLLGSAGLVRAWEGPATELDHHTYLPLIVKPLPPTDLKVTLESQPEPHVPGGELGYTITVTNAGPTAVDALTLELDLPPALRSPLYAPALGTYHLITETWAGTVLTAGRAMTMAVTGTVSETFTGTLTASVSVAPLGARELYPADNVAEEHNPTLAPLTDRLVNPGFEGVTEPGGHTHDTFDGNWYSEVMPPEGWVAWWDPSQHNQFGSEMGRPETMPIPNEGYYVGPPARIYEDHWAVKLFTFGRAHDAGFYQQVDGLPVGSTATFSAYAHAWSCGNDDDAYSCGDPWAFNFRVGIDPTGGTDPWGESVIWCEPAYIYDVYERVGRVEATVGEEGTITVFLRSTAKWQAKHNDAYWDAAELVVQP